MNDAGPPADLVRAHDRWRIFAYLGVLTMLLAFGAPFGGLFDIPLSFLLKNKLHLSAAEVAEFRLLAAIPLYLSGLFGFARDLWNPFGMKDRGFLMIFGAAAAAGYVVFAFLPVSRDGLLASVLLLTCLFLFVAGAQNGLAATLGQQNLMSGRISAAWNIFTALPTMAAFLAGGRLSEVMEGHAAGRAVGMLFLAGAAVMALVALFGLARPRSVFGHLRAEPSVEGRPLADLRRLLRHRPIYPALLIWLLWNFAPGAATPLQYYLQNTLHAGDAQWGAWNAIFTASFLPTFLLYGLLCHLVALRWLLLGGTVVAVPQFVPLLFIHSVPGALWAAVPIGLMGGMATAAYMDLLIRACPRGLQGTVLMLSTSGYYLAGRFGDVLGTWLYDRHGGFTSCVAAVTLVYAAILPVLLLVPRHLVAVPDGRALPPG